MVRGLGDKPNNDGEKSEHYRGQNITNDTLRVALTILSIAILITIHYRYVSEMFTILIALSTRWSNVVTRCINTIEQVIDSLNYDYHQFEIVSFVNYIAQLRNRSIILQSLEFKSQLCAIWFRDDRLDYIFYRNQAPAVYKVHGILHEIGHMVLGHRGQILDDVLQEELVSEAANKRYLESPEEQDAELFAMQVKKRVIAYKRLDKLVGKSSSIEGLQPFIDSGF